jgi:hypothetical protein
MLGRYGPLLIRLYIKSAQMQEELGLVLSITMSSQFALAKSCTTHLIVQPSDLALNPPESYLFIQDFLIISCGVLYALCYLFYMFRTYRDKKVAGNIEFL